MNKTLRNNQSGIAHIVAILTVVVVAVVAASGYFVYQKVQDNKLSPQEKLAKTATKDAKCTTTTDKDLCKFYKAMSVSSFTSMNMTMTSTDNEKSTIKMLADGTNGRMTMTGSGVTMDIIAIGTTTYTKGGATWYKKVDASTASSVTSISTSLKNEIKEPTANSTNVTTFTKVGKEKCGDLNCFKYQVHDPEDAQATGYMWFDDKSYLMRRASNSSSTTGASDGTIGYEKVTISAPTPVVELNENQYMMPGAAEPTTIPSAADTTDLSI